MTTQLSIYKQLLINQFNNKLVTNLPKELCETIKSYCFYDTKTYQILCNICRYKVDICDIINEHVINNEQLFIDSFLDYDDSGNILDNDYTTIIYTIQRYIPETNNFEFTINNIIDLCLLCGNYISCKTENIPRRIKCNCNNYFMI